MSGIKEEFEKAFEEFKNNPSCLNNFKDTVSAYDFAIWAASWMAERCAKEADRQCGVPTYHGHCSCAQLHQAAIRQLSKELSA